MTLIKVRATRLGPLFKYIMREYDLIAKEIL